ncbi:serine hydrolase domain-containing protein [Crossiella cryophila]|uniref:D-alanyl-D-alanine carboxypeptidase n=1 Tax=Crossiella cryophila TaxID=43355 RepID=A0A7W7FVN0_9PSEU|nr:serine hydrolase domain-containing protein [Crossiella cryophila]MBB4679220.1 D-alanyl-D-alanine carboxypeptidase [Crossiella cryophila]
MIIRLAAATTTALLLATTPAAATPPRHPRVQQAVDNLTRKHDLPGAQLRLNGTHVFTSGKGDLGTGAPIPRDSTARIGSITKTFVATVVLQLAAEGRLTLEDTVGQHLPGLINRNGNDGNRITVRQLLQHTSGLPEHVGELEGRGYEKVRYGHFTAQDLLDIALNHQPDFAPGTQWRYSNTGYVVAGLLIEKLTGHRWGEEVTRRIIKPLGLRDTSVPTEDDLGLPGPHARGYQILEDGRRADFTRLNTTAFHAAGAMISTSADLTRFFDTLVNGDLLPPAQHADLTRTVPSGDGWGYGLGINARDLPCGVRWWGHAGSVFGWFTYSAVTTTGRKASIIVNQAYLTDAQSNGVGEAINAAFCP